MDSLSPPRTRTDTGESTSTRRTRTDTGESTSTQRTRTDTEESTTTQAITTLMIGGLPCHLNLSDLVHVISSQGFQNAFDLVYLPRPKGRRTRNRSSQANSGFAFVNFKTPELARAFRDVFSKFSFQKGE